MGYYPLDDLADVDGWLTVHLDQGDPGGESCS
jgi:hypothetical protein